LDTVRELSSLYCFYIQQVVVKTLPEHKMQVAGAHLHEKDSTYH